jgi:GNAT superfamily N-acetyltransferase
MSRVQIRIAVESDAGPIALVLSEAFAEYRSQYTQMAFDATCPSIEVVLKRMSEGPVWVAELDGGVAGTVAAVSKGDRLYIRGMAILPAARGLAIGRLLLETVQQHALDHGRQRMTLSTTPFLSRAIRVYGVINRWMSAMPGVFLRRSRSSSLPRLGNLCRAAF